MRTASDVPFLNILDPDFDYDSPRVAQARETSWFARTPLGVIVLRHRQAWEVLHTGDRRRRRGPRAHDLAQPPAVVESFPGRRTPRTIHPARERCRRRINSCRIDDWPAKRPWRHHAGAMPMIGAESSVSLRVALVVFRAHSQKIWQTRNSPVRCVTGCPTALYCSEVMKTSCVRSG